jgi:hypothetical protein
MTGPIRLYMSMSLDGFITGPDDREARPSATTAGGYSTGSATECPQAGRPFFATGALAEPLRLENPTTIVPGDRVTHLVYDVSR